MDADLVNAVASLLVAIGFKKTIYLCIITVIINLVYSWLEERKRNSLFNKMVAHKDKEIERLADDNRRYRDVYLRNFGLEEGEIRKLTASDIKKEKGKK